MLHPHTELRFVSPEIGYGIFATSFIPKGTITWVKDELDRIIPKEKIKEFSPANLENLLKYTYRTSTGDYFFCWDLTRFVNHSFTPNSMLTSLGFEIAIRDINIGDEMTNDYGTLNIIEKFQCAHSPTTNHREFVCPDDLLKFHNEWDNLISSAFELMKNVNQPLNDFLSINQKSQLKNIVEFKEKIPSILNNYFEEK
jgi:uncharacterized protein